MVAEIKLVKLSRTAGQLFLSHPLLEKSGCCCWGFRTTFRKLSNYKWRAWGAVIIR